MHVTFQTPGKSLCMEKLHFKTHTTKLIGRQWCGAQMLRVNEMEGKDKDKHRQEHHPCESTRP